MNFRLMSEFVENSGYEKPCGDHFENDFAIDVEYADNNSQGRTPCPPCLISLVDQLFLLPLHLPLWHVVD